MMRFVVTGTDTGIGKTIFSAALTGALLRRHGAVRYWKPVQAGLEEETDSEAVARLAPGASVLPEAYRLVTPASPHLAARIDGVALDPARLMPPAGHGPLVVEGAGGALVPLSENLLYADLFARWALPVVVVARTTLGTINHTVMTVEVLRARGCDVAGIAFVGDAHDENERIIPALTAGPRLGRLPMLAQVTPESLATAFDEGFAGWL